MKLVPVLASVLAVACVSVAGAQEVSGPFEEAGFVPVVGQDVKLTPALRRQLQTGSGTTDAPTTTAPATTTATPTTTAPATTTATPRTTAPTPTTATPTSTTATPDATTATPTSTTATPDATTATPTSTTATPEATTATPSSTTATPSATTATPSATSAASSTSTDTTASTSTPSATESATTSSNSGSASSSGASADTSSGSSMSTGAVIGIVVGIVAAVAVIATIIMCVIRRRREADDDPLSPFELSMDKGYNPGYNAQNAYNPRAMGAVGASASGSMSNTRTPPADALAAGVAYSQFYDNAATSPGSMNRLESNVDSVQTDPGNNPNVATNGTNLWLSAMEPKDNDSYLSAHESPRSSRDSSRNSYEVSSNQNIDVDQSSQISGHSNKEGDDFPDHHEDNDSARGSYEL
ncbi:hypothetical protein PHYPSEUDO_015537 [Phytophthora pseudosyringae]|uniref:Mid2 domain-containing protein n=1 Tax=Phytophthora pseudosyringae TaxID=221518 RepID=A0A8T1VYP8_9STRA|nr:hypothetical protein PHYPSEUDO_015537 [Phytophthora pseudosyringae]